MFDHEGTEHKGNVACSKGGYYSALNKRSGQPRTVAARWGLAGTILSDRTVPEGQNLIHAHEESKTAKPTKAEARGGCQGREELSPDVCEVSVL